MAETRREDEKIDEQESKERNVGQTEEQRRDRRPLEGAQSEDETESETGSESETGRTEQPSGGV